MSTKFNEWQLRDHVETLVPELRSQISNLGEIESQFRGSETEFLSVPLEEGGPTAKHILKRILARRSFPGLDCMHDLRSLGTEVPMLERIGPGGVASADILAIAEELTTFFIIEVKKAAGTERQAAGELSAYSMGLHDRFFGMNATDTVWIPLSTAWNQSVRKAFAYQALCAGRAILPMKAEVTLDQTGTELSDVDLTLLNLLDEVDEPLASSLFSVECFDAFQICFAEKLPEPQSFLNAMVGTGSRLGLSGFVFYGESVLGDSIMYPHQIVLVFHNPYRGALKRRQLELMLESNGLEEMRCQVAEPVWTNHDMNFLTGEDLWEEPGAFANVIGESWRRQKDEQVPEKEYVPSLTELASNGINRISRMYDETMSRVGANVEYDLHASNFGRLWRSPSLFTLPMVSDVHYFGLFEEAIECRMQWEHAFARQSGEFTGPVFGEIGSDITQELYTFDTLRQFLELMNWQHDRQEGLRRDSSQSAIDCHQ